MAQARVIDGKAIAAGLADRIAEAATALRLAHRFTPGLAAVLVGDDPASRIYVRNKARACAEAGFASFTRELPGDIEEAALRREVDLLNADDRVDGILVQLPLPAGLDRRRIVAAIDPGKDVDGFHPLNIGHLWNGSPAFVPCTPQGVLLLLRSVHENLAGAEAVVIGRSDIVGKPTAALLLAADCTVTMAHSKTRELAALCRRTDIVVAAAGRPLMVKADWIRAGATVIDVGITRITMPDGRGRLVGDVDYAAVAAVAGAITPVPGGVGPMTIACLLRNTLRAACHRRGIGDPLEV